jgi:hypothetical protein
MKTYLIFIRQQVLIILVPIFKTYKSLFSPFSFNILRPQSIVVLYIYYSLLNNELFICDLQSNEMNKFILTLIFKTLKQVINNGSYIYFLSLFLIKLFLIKNISSFLNFRNYHCKKTNSCLFEKTIE